MATKKKTEKERNPSVGTVAIVETKTGELQIRLDFKPDEGTEPNLMQRIYAAVTGLAYTYDHFPEKIESIGQSYLDGIEEGITQIKRMQKDDKNKRAAYQGSKVGFASDLDDESE